jgi:hypothetical protein
MTKLLIKVDRDVGQTKLQVYTIGLD